MPDMNGVVNGGPDAESIAIRKTNLAVGRKVFWGGHTNLADPVIHIPNPLHPSRSNIYRQDLWYHLSNHQCLLSMAYADSLDAYGGVWGHRVIFWFLCMLLFGVAVALQTSAAATLVIRAGAAILISGKLSTSLCRSTTAREYTRGPPRIDCNKGARAS